MPSKAPVIALVAAVLGAALSGSPPAAAQTTVAENTSTNNVIGAYYFGQSFTASTTADHVTFAFKDGSGADVANGTLYLFSSPYAGTPASLAASTGAANYVAQAGAAGNNYAFADAFTLNGGSQYFAYSDTAQTLAYSDANPYSGGGAYGAQDAGSNYTDTYSQTHDFGFSVRSMSAGVQSAPEPATWLLMITGFGIAGYGLRRRPGRRIRVA